MAGAGSVNAPKGARVVGKTAVWIVFAKTGAVFAERRNLRVRISHDTAVMKRGNGFVTIRKAVLVVRGAAV